VLPFARPHSRFLPLLTLKREKMTNTNVHPHSKGAFAERFFGIHRLSPPNVHDIPSADLPMHLTLGDFRLNLDNQTGRWTLADGLVQSLQDQIANLQQQLQLAEREKQTLLANPVNNSDYSESVILDMERKQIELEKTNIQLLHENQTLKFKNKVLTAMTAIAEGDYRALCQEAGIDTEVIRQSSHSQLSPLKRSISSASSQMTPNVRRELSYHTEADRTVKAPLRYQVSAM